MAISKCLLDAFGEKGVLGGIVALGSLFTLTNELELSTSCQISSLWSFYEHSFHKNPYMPTGHNLQHLPLDSGELCRHWSFVTWSLNFFLTFGHIKFYRMYLGKKGVRDKLLSVHFFLVKRAPELLISNRISPLRSLCDDPFYIWPLEKTIIINNKTL